MGKSMWCKGYLHPDGIVKSEDERYYRFDGKELECSRHPIRKIRMVPEKVANLFLDYDLTYAMISAKSGWGVMELREFFERVQEYMSELTKDELRKKHRAEVDRKYYQNNREKRNAYQREYYQNHREQMHENKRKYYLKNREKINERQREYRAKNLDKRNEYQREYMRKRREQRKLLNQASNS